MQRIKEGRRPFRVLVVDDNRDAADSLALLVKMWGHDVRVAYDGADGLRTACDYLPDCLLLDISMPRLDGYRLARHVREQEALSGSKLVALTAYSDEYNVHRAYEAGFNYHLVKPADPDVVRRLLTMLEKVVQLTEKTQLLAEQTVELTRETTTLLKDMKQEVREVKEDIKEVKQELREVKKDLRDVRGTGDKGI